MTEQMTFGKYKGQPVTDVIAKDPRYALWAHCNVSYFKLGASQIQDCVIRSDVPPFFPRSPIDDDGGDYGYGGMGWSDFGNN